MTDVTCGICGTRVGRGPGGLGIIMHSRKHRRQHHAIVGEWPDDYDGVCELAAFAEPPGTRPASASEDTPQCNLEEFEEADADE